MPTATNAVASSLQALTEQYRLITDNLANVSTPGFKRKRVSFGQTLADAVGLGEPAPATGQISAISAVDFSQGPLTRTDKALDLALEGTGFFTLQTVDGELYTRCGKFRVNAQRQLVDPAGRIVGGDGGAPIVLPPTASTLDVQVSRDGTVRAGGATVGRLGIVSFSDLSKLVPEGNGCFQALPDAGRQDAKVGVLQGFVEGSNVSAVEELVGLITVTRLYEANLKSISVQDEQMKTILQVAMS